MVIFREQGEATTREAARIAWAAAVRLDAPLLVATTSGQTAALALQMALEAGEVARLRVIAHAYGTRVPGQNAMLPEHREALARHGVPIVFAAHALSGVERGLSTKFSGIYPAELIAHTLRLLSQGTKVAVEIGVMAQDAGIIPYGAPVVTLAGSGSGADTATVLTPANAQNILETRVHEILCKPW